MLDAHAPLKTVKVFKGKPSHCLSHETLHIRKERNTAKNAWLKASPSEKKIKAVVYKRLRNRVNSLIKRDRAQKSEQDLKKGKHPCQIAKSLLGDTKQDSKLRLSEGDKVIEDEKEVATLINNFFVE